MTTNKMNWLLIGILALIAALVYLPLAGKMGLYNDDWYLLYDAHTQGSQFFHEIYAIDRPARAYVMQAAYDLFGDYVLYYHLSAYFFRVLAACSLFWSLNMVWISEKKLNFLVSLLFLIYPGFLSQINPIDYQSQILSLCLAISSIAFTLKSIISTARHQKFIWFGMSLISGIIYPALVDYFIGLEILRLGFIINLVLQKHKSGLKEIGSKILYQWIPFLFAPLVFLIWRIFFFTAERRATDIGIQLGELSSPLTMIRWLVNWAQDTLRVLFLAWSVPLNGLGFNLRLGDFLLGVAIAIIASLLAVVGYKGFRSLTTNDPSLDDVSLDWRNSVLIMGIVTAVFALLPVIIANRHVDFENYSRYALASAAGAGMFMAALIASLNSRWLRLWLVAFLVYSASFVHYANAVHAVQATESVREFWWQVAWRAPGFKPGTTLVASYSGSGIQEDYFVWGPANLIYYPEKQDIVPIEIKLPAAVLTNDVISQILSHKGSESPLRRGNQLTREFDNIVVISQADPNSCVHIIDGRLPELSIHNQEKIMLVAPNSKLDNVLIQGITPMPPVDVFGTEPMHEWCFYFQKADLARQQGDWQMVMQLGAEAQQLGLHPNDQIEWLPFLQAYAILGDQKKVKEISARINTEPFYQHQACENLNAMTGYGHVISSEIQSQVDELFCKK